VKSPSIGTARPHSGIEVASTQDQSDHIDRYYIMDHTMRTISLLNILAIAVGLGGCTNGDGLQNPRQASKMMVDNPVAQADDPRLL
jgi:hypothetical protein